MMFNLLHTLDDKIEENEKKIASLCDDVTSLSDKITTFWDTLKLQPQQMETFLNTPENFTDEEWNYLATHKKELEEKLKKQLNAVTNPLQARKNRSTQNTQQHWLFVR